MRLATIQLTDLDRLAFSITVIHAIQTGETRNGVGILIGIRDEAITTDTLIGKSIRIA